MTIYQPDACRLFNPPMEGMLHYHFIGATLVRTEGQDSGVIDIEAFRKQFDNSIAAKAAADGAPIMLDIEASPGQSLRWFNDWDDKTGAFWPTERWQAAAAEEDRQSLECLNYVRSRCPGNRIISYGYQLFGRTGRDITSGLENYWDGRTPMNRDKYKREYPAWAKFSLRNGGYIEALDALYVEQYFQFTEPQMRFWWPEMLEALSYWPKPLVHLFWARPGNHTQLHLHTFVAAFAKMLATYPETLEVALWRDGVEDEPTAEVRDVAGYFVNTLRAARR